MATVLKEKELAPNAVNSRNPFMRYKDVAPIHLVLDSSNDLQSFVKSLRQNKVSLWKDSTLLGVNAAFLTGATAYSQVYNKLNTTMNTILVAVTGVILALQIAFFAKSAINHIREIRNSEKQLQQFYCQNAAVTGRTLLDEYEKSSQTPLVTKHEGLFGAALLGLYAGCRLIMDGGKIAWEKITAIELLLLAYAVIPYRSIGEYLGERSFRKSLEKIERENR